MILMKHMEVIPVLVIKTTTSCHMEALRKNGPHAAKLTLKHVTCKSKVIGAWKLRLTMYVEALQHQPHQAQHLLHQPQHHHLLDVLDLVVPLIGKVMTGVTMKTIIVDVNGMVETVAEIM